MSRDHIHPIDKAMQALHQYGCEHVNVNTLTPLGNPSSGTCSHGEVVNPIWNLVWRDAHNLHNASAFQYSLSTGQWHCNGDIGTRSSAIFQRKVRLTLPSRWKIMLGPPAMFSHYVIKVIILGVVNQTLSLRSCAVPEIHCRAMPVTGTVTLIIRCYAWNTIVDFFVHNFHKWTDI